MFKIFHLLGVYFKNVYFCMIFTFVFFFERSIQVPIKIMIEDKEIEYLPLVIYIVHDFSLLGSTADFVIKKRNIWDFYHIWPSPNVRDVG